ncbi:aldehyde dehydrogenase [Flagellimonas flava]|uniref:Aldehyde dehydrogenase n=1 Tax=Flagellimonas flava TaxID=570519 RepID=A0A1M5IS12_9FLAO|nr:aldehyde dehydrogenase [Allomuricauda flava]SHG31036.1 aldehyde dehydrogenase (NAD+) [Allomuricauda flava]
MLKELVKDQREFFASQQTKNVKYRIKYLKLLQKALVKYEDVICEALYKDFKKPTFETLATETQLVLSELNYILNRLELWAKPKRVGFTWANFPSSDWIYSEPYGNTLVISPWNYPILLTLSPLVGALAAGNTVVIKPSELSPNTSAIIAKIIAEVFPEEYVSVVEGGVSTSAALLKERWDYIFFTGSSKVAKIVYKAAAEHLTPVTLELGGKNPCIVDESAAIKVAAKRIVWSKFMNAGQTCVAPDYILVHKKVKDKFVGALKRQIAKFYGDDVQQSSDYARIATDNHYKSLKQKLGGQEILLGGICNDSDRYVAPTLINEPSLDSALMSDEIFGPILPIISYETEANIENTITTYDKSLALYVFSKKRKFQKRIINRYGFGGGVINDAVMQIANKELPFGGVGQAGIGAYHGKHSFDLFSHKKAIIKKPNWLDIPLRYAPYKLPIRLAKQFKRLF